MFRQEFGVLFVESRNVFFVYLLICLFVGLFFLSFFLSSAILYVSLICQYGHATRCSATITIVYSISVTCCNLSMPRKMFSAVSSADCLRHVVFACPLISTSGVQTPSRAARFPTMESCEEFCCKSSCWGCMNNGTSWNALFSCRLCISKKLCIFRCVLTCATVISTASVMKCVNIL